MPTKALSQTASDTLILSEAQEKLFWYFLLVADTGILTDEQIINLESRSNFSDTLILDDSLLTSLAAPLLQVINDTISLSDETIEILSYLWNIDRKSTRLNSSH